MPKPEFAVIRNSDCIKEVRSELLSVPRRKYLHIDCASRFGNPPELADMFRSQLPANGAHPADASVPAQFRGVI
jgi:hypothetical protein